MQKLYYGGTILTMDEAFQGEALLIEDGKILAVGSLQDLEKMAPDCEKEDLCGKTLMPGFIDPHSHFFQVAASLLQVSLDGVSDVGEMARRIHAFAEKNQIAPGQWIVARDYDNNVMPGLKNPGIRELDAFAPHNPLVIHHKSGHMGLMNSEALRIIGITTETVAPEGGRIEQEDGKLTGYMEENAFFEAIKKIPMAGPRQLLNAFDGAQNKYASYGITTLQDGMVVDQMLPMYEMLLKEKKLYLDVVLYAGVSSYDATCRLLEKYPENQNLSCGGMKMFLDGSPQGRTAWMREPYEGEKEYKGYGTMTDEAVEQAFCKAAEKHTQIIAHSNGDGAAEQFLRCLKKAEDKHPELHDLRPVLIHGQLAGVDQLPRAAELGAAISFFIAHIYHWGDVHIRNFGMKRAEKISPAKSAMDAGVLVTFHQDSPVIEPNMMETIWCAVNRITKSGVQLDVNEKISTMDALKAVTVNAAYQYHEENEKGSLTPGKKADLVVLDRNPLETPPEDLRKIRVMETYKNGCRVYCAE